MAVEIKVKTQRGAMWMAMAIVVVTRLWVGGQTSPTRDKTLLAALVERIRNIALYRPLLLAVDGLPGYVDVFRKSFRTPLPSGKPGRPRLIAWTDIHNWLDFGASLSHEQTAGTCRQLLRHWPILWTFTLFEGVELTNNAVEQALRHGVIYRKLSYGTAAEGGSRFVERILTVIATACQQGIDLMCYLHDAMLAQRAGIAAPALL